MTLEDLVWRSPEGIKVKPIYVPEDLKDVSLPCVHLNSLVLLPH